MLLSKKIITETGHRLLNYDGLCGHLHGHSYNWEVTVSGDVNENGFVMDFSELKEILKNTIGMLDHACILSSEDLLVTEVENPCKLFKGTENNESRLLIVDFNPTVENIVNYAAELIRNKLPHNIKLYSIKCQETKTSRCELI